MQYPINFFFVGEGVLISGGGLLKLQFYCCQKTPSTPLHFEPTYEILSDTLEHVDDVISLFIPFSVFYWSQLRVSGFCRLTLYPLTEWTSCENVSKPRKMPHTLWATSNPLLSYPSEFMNISSARKNKKNWKKFSLLVKIMQ